MRLAQVFAPRPWRVGKAQACGHCPLRSGRGRASGASGAVVDWTRVGVEAVKIEVRMYAGDVS